MTDEEMVQLVLDWAESHPKFDTSFVESLAESLEEFDELTPNQRAALENIIAKFHIE